MINARGEPSGSGNGGGGGGFHRLQAERDLESNWELDLGQKLEEYLLKICSGEIPTEAEGHVAINFAEAALLLQGSIQVYSRKVEYLYSLVLRALEFLSQKGQHEQSEGTSVRPEEGESSRTVSDEENDMFWGLDDISVEGKNCLDSPVGRDAPLNSFVKPPANLVVLEGDCLDTTGDFGELESYLLATNDLYQDFILLDPCDAVAVHDYLSADGAGKGQNSAYKATSTQKSYQSPTKRSGGTARRSSLHKCQDPNVNQTPGVGCSFEAKNCNIGPDPRASNDFDDGAHGFDMDDRYSEPRDLDESDDEDDPWKPLNPHEPGNLKVKPFRKVKASNRKGVSSTKQVSMITLFPPAKLHGTISPELTEMWEMQRCADERQKGSQSPPLFEKLRESLINGRHETFDAFCNPMGANEDTEYDNEIPDFGHTDADMPEPLFMDENVPPYNDKFGDGCPQFGTDEAFGYDNSKPHACLEDLCRSHLDALLASIAETEKQTELATRVSTWKQKIEHNLEEQELHPAFDIHDYGKRILDRLSFEPDSVDVLSFADVVKGQEKYDVARSFSALLQLVNNGNVELDRSGVDGESVCYTAVNPFHVRLLKHDKRREDAGFRLSRKRFKSPLSKACGKVDKDNTGTAKSPIVKSSSKVHKSTEASSQINGKSPVKLGKVSGIRCTPEPKRRRKSRFVEPVDLHSAG
ncbi:PREDICTED: condensin-2 complex subunit H2 [Prunus dulcis]|uniref:Condensin-2 complex subunit H2 n=1 Tax=Prunus dulcis TaxID=3755 RepID=A0A5E4GBG4_PRUDU|nr:condensin-2 complex subunit H2 isoform X2 [Prunus dulcis]VVA37149.1 PREDICTED: condensin-2 complex subunit H2 [Prunus dulcis]